MSFFTVKKKKKKKTKVRRYIQASLKQVGTNMQLMCPEPFTENLMLYYINSHKPHCEERVKSVLERRTVLIENLQFTAFQAT
jgi:hypothetical protein